ncbi:MAG TPA: chalcone isomerase family protein [Usitatibacteraceae bacterium]|nr:chalcone isomerase family protein [Usitatibacteraceae bacterium]
MRALAASVLAAALAWPGAAAGQALPAPVARESPPLLVQGEGTMRFFGLKVYDIRLWTPMKVFSHSEPFALELIYDMSLKGRDIAEKSIELMREQGHGDEAKLKRWGEAMARVFPDIRKGDTLIGVSVPGKEARFYTRDKFIAAVADPEFSRAFFDIWLSEKTTAPGVRQKLLGGQGQ